MNALFPLFTEQLSSLCLCGFPCGVDLFEQRLSNGGQLKRFRVPFEIQLLQPAIGFHPFDVPAQCRFFQAEDTTNAAGTDRTEFGDGDQDVALADSQSKRAQRVVVNRGHDPIEKSHSNGQAFAAHSIELNSQGRLSAHAFGCTCNSSRDQDETSGDP